MKGPRIQSIFGPTIQGEGPLIGQACVFIRTGGCDYRCDWCDTMYAVDPKRFGETWAFMTEEEIVAKVQAIAGAANLVMISGGNPAMQPLGDLCGRLWDQGFYVAVETQGSIRPDWALEPHLWIVSPKPPSAKVEKPNLDTLRAFAVSPEVPAHFKIPVADQTDLDWAIELKRVLNLDEIYLQPVNLYPNARLANPVGMLEALDWLVGAAREMAEPGLIVLPQLHALLWGNKQDV